MPERREPTVLPVPESEKTVLRNLLQAYRHDLSEFDGSDPDDAGSFGVGSYFDLYWTEPSRHPFKILIGDSLAGFVLVRELQAETRSIAEFFVLRRHRRSGIGQSVAFQLFDRFPGSWHVAQDEHNVPAQAFWRRVVSAYTYDRYTEGWSESQPCGPQQVFRSRSKR